MKSMKLFSVLLGLVITVSSAISRAEADVSYDFGVRPAAKPQPVVDRSVALTHFPAGTTITLARPIDFEIGNNWVFLGDGGHEFLIYVQLHKDLDTTYERILEPRVLKVASAKAPYASACDYDIGPDYCSHQRDPITFKIQGDSAVDSIQLWNYGTAYPDTELSQSNLDYLHSLGITFSFPKAKEL
ncbi:hypothetical protein [Bdellovibrio sp.]|uniref:hypothetical protein n=1 Tax=Bdellovibrio sp. TaxID=28201 RepID=UPI0039E37909